MYCLLGVIVVVSSPTGYGILALTAENLAVTIFKFNIDLEGTAGGGGQGFWRNVFGPGPAPLQQKIKKE